MSRLTDREREVLGLVVEGHQNKEIASLLNISLKTVTAHLTSIFASLGVTNRTQAALWASGSLREQIGMHPDGPAALAATNELMEQLVAEVERLRESLADKEGRLQAAEAENARLTDAYESSVVDQTELARLREALQAIEDATRIDAHEIARDALGEDASTPPTAPHPRPPASEIGGFSA